MIWAVVTERFLIFLIKVTLSFQSAAYHRQDVSLGVNDQIADPRFNYYSILIDANN